MSDKRKPDESPSELPVEAAQTRLFELYIESLVGDLHVADELLLVHLKLFSEDVQSTADRLRENPRLALTLVKHLSGIMQDLDAAAGGTEALADQVKQGRRWALLLPDTRLHE